MSGYTKLFSDIVESSIWNEPPDTCKVWITLLALSDQDGYVRGSVGWLAGKARVSKDKCAAAIALFQKPDEESRTPDHEGRRIEVLEDGWLILNYIVFRDRLSQNPLNVKTRERVKRHRERYKALRNASSVTTPDSASASASSSESVLKEGMQGENLPAFSFSSIPEILKAIKQARPEFHKLRDMTIEAVISSCPPDLRQKTFRDFVENTANMIECPKDPIGLMKGYVRKASEKTSAPTGSSLVFCKVCQFDMNHCKCNKVAK